MNVLKNYIFLLVIPYLKVVITYDYYPSYGQPLAPIGNGYSSTVNNNNNYNSRTEINNSPPPPPPPPQTQTQTYDAFQAFFQVTTPAVPIPIDITTPAVQPNEEKVKAPMNPSNITVDELINECVDLYPNCPEFAKHNYCVKFRKQMLFQCRKSCDFCDLHPLENSIEDEDNNEESNDTEVNTAADSDDENEEDDTNSVNITIKPENGDSDNDNSEDENNDNNDNNNNNNNEETEGDNDETTPEVVEKVKKSSSTKKHKLIFKSRSPIYEQIINTDPSKNLGAGFSKNNYDNLKERFHIPGYEPTAEEIYAETGQIAVSSLDSHKNKRGLRKSKRNSIPKAQKSSDPYQYLKTMDDTKESMEPIRDSRKHPENSSLFKSSVDSIKQFFYPRNKRSSPSSEKREISPNQGVN